MMSKKSIFLPTLTVLSSILFSSNLLAHNKGDILIRAGVGVVIPNESSDDPNNIGELSLNNDVNLAGTISYMVTDNIGIEALVGLPFTHEISSANLGAVADASHLPFSMAAQYYFLEADSKIRPYVGAGFNYTSFLDEESKGKLAGATVTVDNSFGYALQAGVDVSIQDNWFANLSIWYLDIETTIQATNVNDIDVVVDPLAVMAAVGYKF